MEISEILVVDKNASSRTRLQKIVYDLGGKLHKIHSCGSLEEATAILNSKSISLVLSDYFITGGSGFDLFKMIRAQQPDNKSLCLVLVTSNISQTAVAKAAEEDVDSFVIKPFTIQSIHENLLTTVVSKIQPSEYMQKIDSGKELIKNGSLEEAMTVLKEAIPLHPQPALALFYIGQIEIMQKFLSKAQGSFQQGLTFNTIHYKCLVGLYDLFMRQRKYKEAYEVVKKVSNYFPANPDRLTQVVRLAIQTENYRDMQSFYDVFTTLDERTPVLVNYIGAGLFVAGKFLMNNKEEKLALQFFENLAISCSEYTKFLRAIVVLLTEKGKAREAEKFLSRFPVLEKSGEDYLVCDFLIVAGMAYDSGATIRRGLELYNKNIRNESCLAALIKEMERAGHKKEKIEKYRSELEELKNPSGKKAA